MFYILVKYQKYHSITTISRVRILSNASVPPCGLARGPLHSCLDLLGESWVLEEGLPGAFAAPSAFAGGVPAARPLVKKKRTGCKFHMKQITQLYKYTGIYMRG